MIAQLGEAPSPGLPIRGSKREPCAGTFMFEAFTSIPAASISIGDRFTISLAGRKTSQACFSVVAPLYTSAPNSLSATNMLMPTPAAITDLPFLRGTSQ